MLPIRSRLTETSRFIEDSSPSLSTKPLSRADVEMLVGYVIVGVRGQDSYQSPFRDGVRSLASYAFRRGPNGLRARHLPLTRASGRPFSVQWFQLIPTGHDDNSMAYVTENVKAFLPKGGQA